MKYYILYVWGSVEPSLKGPYKTSIERDEAARKLRNNFNEVSDEDGIFWIDLPDDKFNIGSYTNGFMEYIEGFER
jgi:hypothetical protein